MPKVSIANDQYKLLEMSAFGVNHLHFATITPFLNNLPAQHKRKKAAKKAYPPLTAPLPY
jgi:hypothetical protein